MGYLCNVRKQYYNMSWDSCHNISYRGNPRLYGCKFLSQLLLHSSVHSDLHCTHLVSHFVFYVPKTKDGNDLQFCYSVITCMAFLCT